MNKLITAAGMILLAAGIFCGQSLGAQQASTPTQAGGPKPATTAKSAGSTKGAAAAKPGQAAATKRPAAAAASPLKTDKDKRSYAVGLNIGKKVASELKEGGVDLDSAILARGIRDSLTEGKPLLTEQEVQAELKTLETELRGKAQAQFEAMSAANQKEGDEFLSANKSKEGVVALPSGLQYKILKAGTGVKPAATDKVVCNYRGTLISGAEFDSSYKRGEPVTFPVNGVIKGWTEALQLMPVGSKWQLFVPPDLAYGDRGAGQEIGPKSTLIFEVELLSIAPKNEGQPAGGAGNPESKPEAKPQTM